MNTQTTLRKASLTDFAAAVNDTGRRVTGDGRASEWCVFLSALYTQLASERTIEMQLSRFKGRLVEAMREGLVKMHRCDMPGLFPRCHYDNSEIDVGYARFHYLEH